MKHKLHRQEKKSEYSNSEIKECEYSNIPIFVAILKNYPACKELRTLEPRHEKTNILHTGRRPIYVKDPFT